MWRERMKVFDLCFIGLLAVAAQGMAQTPRLRPSVRAVEDSIIDSASAGWDRSAVREAPQTTGKQSKIDVAKEADIRRLMVLTHTTLLDNQTIGTMEANVRPAITNVLPPGEYRAKLVDLFVAKYKSKLNPEELKERAIPVYDKHFSAAEIKEMIRFYESPLGQKVLKEMPIVTAELQQIGQAWGAKFFPRIAKSGSSSKPLRRRQDPSID